MRKECRPKNIRVINYDKVLSGLQSILDKYDIPTETGVVSDILDFINNLDYADIDSIFNDFEKEELKFYFPEFAPYEGKCRFNGCDHIHEPGCAVKAAVEEGKIHRVRYQDYTEMYRELQERKRY